MKIFYSLFNAALSTHLLCMSWVWSCSSGGHFQSFSKNTFFVRETNLCTPTTFVYVCVCFNSRPVILTALPAVMARL